MAWNSFYGAMCAQLNVIQSYMLALIPSRVFNQLCLNLSFLRSNCVLYSCITLIERYLTPVYIESREAISGSFTMSASRWSASSKRVGCRGRGSERAGGWRARKEANTRLAIDADSGTTPRQPCPPGPRVSAYIYILGAQSARTSDKVEPGAILSIDELLLLDECTITLVRHWCWCWRGGCG